MKGSQVLFIVFCIFVVVAVECRISFSLLGNWTQVNETSRECLLHMCTPSKPYAWISSDPFKLYDSRLGCEKLIEKGISRIFFHGDSYMRQIYSSMLITLSGNYHNGSLIEGSPEHCYGKRQFNEKTCGTRQLNKDGTVCGGLVYLDLQMRGLDDLNSCVEGEKRVFLWSFGNHKLTRYGRYGVNNATAFSELFLRNPCPLIREHKNNNCSIWWVSTHYRMRPYFEDEVPEVIRGYNEGMRSFFESEACGNVNYIDVYNSTQQLGNEDIYIRSLCSIILFTMLLL